MMATILCIDTATEKAIVGLGTQHGETVSEMNADQKSHATFIQPAIQRVLAKASIDFVEIDAVAVVNGPGSYTGLRVGLASAKGICYALNRPLIILNTLTVMASAAVERFNDIVTLYCPLIDARRNEVFTAIYNSDLTVLLPPQPMIVGPGIFNIYLHMQKTLFFGSGHNKCEKVINYENAVFENVSYSVNHVNKLAQNAYTSGQFADIAYIEPFYTKEFFSPTR